MTALEGVTVNAVDGAVRKAGRTVGRAADMTTEAAGAVGGAAVNGVVGAAKGAAAGVQRGLKTGSHSTPAAALTVGALGIAGLVEWPLLLAVGAGALLLRRLKPADAGDRAVRPPKAAPAAKPARKAAKKVPAKAATKPRRSGGSR